jgi:peptide-methionine (S)-S-oxide reductase
MAQTQLATFGGGCFWCIESALNKIKGVAQARSGFAGGARPNPTYQQVITGVSGHAEVVQVEYEPDVISFSQLLDLFFQLHDPTTLNRQGNDIGTQYRSIILIHDQEQRMLAQQKVDELNRAGIWLNPIVTEIKDYSGFYEADEYHQSFADKNPQQPYCAFLITPKLNEFKAKFRDWLK